jgi:hypothetical protein
MRHDVFFTATFQKGQNPLGRPSRQTPEKKKKKKRMHSILVECREKSHVAESFVRLQSVLPFDFRVSDVSFDFCLGWFLMKHMRLSDMKMRCEPRPLLSSLKSSNPKIRTRMIADYTSEDLSMHLRESYHSFLALYFPEVLEKTPHYLIILNSQVGPSLVAFDSFDILLGLASFASWMFGDPTEVIQFCMVDECEQTLYYKFGDQNQQIQKMVGSISSIILDYFPVCEKARCETRVFDNRLFCEVCSGNISSIFLTSLCLEPC